jgi:signal transduction histidine kinase
VRAKQSFTALEAYSCSDFSPAPHSASAALPGAPSGATGNDPSSIPISLLALPIQRPSTPCQAIVHGEGLLHDARNLIGALGLYCDLLSMPGVLKQEHRHYAEDVRQLGARSAAMIQQLMGNSDQAQGPAACSWLSKSPKSPDATSDVVEAKLSTAVAKQTSSAANPVSLRSIVERCSGLLGRVACGRTVEIGYGVAAAVPVRVEEETVERILVNLVRNAAAALATREPASNPATDLGGTGGGEGPCDCAQNSTSAPRCSVHETVADPTDDETPGSIRIGVGLLANRVGDPKPWPFRRVRLTVEDSGCGMTPEELERLLSGVRSPSRGSHGIGFRVVRELAATSGGDLRVMSAPGVGTRVQIEWPMAAVSSMEVAMNWAEPTETFAPDRLSGYSGPPRLGGMSRITGMPGVRMSMRESGSEPCKAGERNPGANGRQSC